MKKSNILMIVCAFMAIHPHLDAQEPTGNQTVIVFENFVPTSVNGEPIYFDKARLRGLAAALFLGGLPPLVSTLIDGTLSNPFIATINFGLGGMLMCCGGCLCYFRSLTPDQSANFQQSSQPGSASTQNV